MPTYKNVTNHVVTFIVKLYGNDGETRRILVDLGVGEEKKLNFALPYASERGIATTSEYPPLPDPIIFDNALRYDEGMTREFAVRPCDKYMVQISVQEGEISYRFGNTGVPGILNASRQFMFEKRVDWESAPLIVLQGTVNDTLASLHVEEVQSGETWRG
jgi:hypothetical protein